MTITTHILIGGPGGSPSDLQHSPLASARLRLAVAATAAQELNQKISLGEQTPEHLDRLIVGKIGANDIQTRQGVWLAEIERLKGLGTRIFLDYTDHHLASNSVMTGFYRAACELADVICTPTSDLKTALIEHFGIKCQIEIVPDLLEHESVKPKKKLVGAAPVGLWFGHPTNAKFLAQFIDSHLQTLTGHTLTIVSSSQTLDILKSHKFSQPPTLAIKAFPWSVQAVAQVARTADYCVIPSDCHSPKRYASNNRLVTALALGLPTLATPLPSYAEFSDHFATIGSEEASELLKHPEAHSRGCENFQNDGVRAFTRPKLVAHWCSLLR
ncbi:MAG: hypothetical protein P8O91_04645 [Luminiphilus sp.]|nr:hypothetical protein [Luminiphilus sp.]